MDSITHGAKKSKKAKKIKDPNAPKRYTELAIVTGRACEMLTLAYKSFPVPSRGPILTPLPTRNVYSFLHVHCL